MVVIDRYYSTRINRKLMPPSLSVSSFTLFPFSACPLLFKRIITQGDIGNDSEKN